MRIVARLFDDNENFLPSARRPAAPAGWDLEIAPPFGRSALEWTFHQRDARLSPSGHLFNLPR